MDPNSFFSIFITIACTVGFFLVFGAVMFWVYGLTPILHWVIKANGVPARAVVLDVKDAGWGWYTGRLGQSLLFQPINVKLEVHPSNGAPYIAMDRFNAKREAYYTIQPGVEMQVAIARFDATWVASLPETAVAIQQQKRAEHIHAAVAENAEAQLGRLKHMLDTGLITQQDFDQKKAQILARM